MKKMQLDPPYIGVQEKDSFTILYDKEGNYSIIMEVENIVSQYGGDIDKYNEFVFIYNNLVKILGAGNSLQKQDVFVKKKYKNKGSQKDYLHEKFMQHFEGREYVDHKTYLILTGETQKSKFFGWDEKKFNAFLQNALKIISFLKDKNINVKCLTKKQTISYIYTYFSFQFGKQYHVNNLEIGENQIKLGEKRIRCISLIDIEKIELPTTIKTYKEINIAGRLFPVDIFDFIINIPDTETVILNQTIQIPEQRKILMSLEAKKKKHVSMPDPANDLCVQDIEKVMGEVAQDGKLLVYAHFDIILSGIKDLVKAENFVESSLFDSGINISKQAYNQFELFYASLPGNSSQLKNYDKFLCTSDVAVTLMYKEKIMKNENSNFNIHFTNRSGIPVLFDPSDLMIDEGKTNNRNKFILGPSGTGKSFFTNFMLRQYALDDCDIVLVDTGHSYQGLCSYYQGRYVTYSEEKPITMNPFKITEGEYNEEKREFLKSLIALIWKGKDGTLNKVEETLISKLIFSFYENYYSSKEGEYNEKEIEGIVEEKWEKGEYQNEYLEYLENCIGENSFEKLKVKYNFQQEKYSEWNDAIYKIGEEKESFLRKKREEYIHRKNNSNLRNEVTSLSFNGFYEFAISEIPFIIENTRDDKTNKTIEFDTSSFFFVLSSFYKNGDYEQILNNEFDNSLFEDKFIVFEIDSIKDHPTLFPIVTLIIMDVFIQKMRLKKNRKALIIEEAWKAIASPLMANYILYLYKTVRKHFGEAMVVTQELADIIGNAVVKDSIIANSDVVILLDQKKFADNYEEIANVLSLNEIEQKKIFTINNLDNKEGRAPFKEVYIKRGGEGVVLGIEASRHEYYTFTTEKREKDAVQIYISFYKDYRKALDQFISDLENFELSKFEFITIVNSNRLSKEIEKKKNLTVALEEIIKNYKESKMDILEYIYL